jgi:hypothetical protein
MTRGIDISMVDENTLESGGRYYRVLREKAETGPQDVLIEGTSKFALGYADWIIGSQNASMPDRFMRRYCGMFFPPPVEVVSRERTLSGEDVENRIRDRVDDLANRGFLRRFSAAVLDGINSAVSASLGVLGLSMAVHAVAMAPLLGPAVAAGITGTGVAVAVLGSGTFWVTVRRMADEVRQKNRFLKDTLFGAPTTVPLSNDGKPVALVDVYRSDFKRDPTLGLTEERLDREPAFERRAPGRHLQAAADFSPPVPVSSVPSPAAQDDAAADLNRHLSRALSEDPDFAAAIGLKRVNFQEGANVRQMIERILARQNDPELNARFETLIADYEASANRPNP